MLLKIGNRIVNTDQIAYANYEPPAGSSNFEPAVGGSDATLSIYLVNVSSGNERRTTVVSLEGSEAAATWKVLTAEARDVMREHGGSPEASSDTL